LSQIQLRAYVFLDSLQPQLAAHICTTCRGYFPVPYVASLFVEIAPGMAIHQVMDSALEGTDVQPAYAVLAANGAEKAADVRLIDVTPFGAYARLYMAGGEAEIDSAAQAATSALGAVSGRELAGGRAASA
jgi:hypothetical protein